MYVYVCVGCVPHSIHSGRRQPLHTPLRGVPSHISLTPSPCVCNIIRTPYTLDMVEFAPRSLAGRLVNQFVAGRPLHPYIVHMPPKHSR